MLKKRRNWRTGAAALLAPVLLVLGCAGGGASFIHPNVNFGNIRKCALLPFQNLTSDSFADDRMQSVFLTELLNHPSLALVDPEETVSAMRELRLPAGSALSPEQVVALGKALKVDAVFGGSVEEYGLPTHMRQQAYTVTAVFNLAETETGSVIWRSQVHVDGSSWWRKLIGSESVSLYDVSRQAVRTALGSLF